MKSASLHEVSRHLSLFKLLSGSLLLMLTGLLLNEPKGDKAHKPTEEHFSINGNENFSLWTAEPKSINSSALALVTFADDTDCDGVKDVDDAEPNNPCVPYQSAACDNGGCPPTDIQMRFANARYDAPNDRILVSFEALYAEQHYRLDDINMRWFYNSTALTFNGYVNGSGMSHSSATNGGPTNGETTFGFPAGSQLVYINDTGTPQVDLVKDQWTRIIDLSFTAAGSTDPEDYCASIVWDKTDDGLSSFLFNHQGTGITIDDWPYVRDNGLNSSTPVAHLDPTELPTHLNWSTANAGTGGSAGNPIDPGTDCTGVVAACTDPNLYADNCDFDGDGVLNGVDLDDDNDGILDAVEGCIPFTVIEDFENPTNVVSSNYDNFATAFPAGTSRLSNSNGTYGYLVGPTPTIGSNTHLTAQDGTGYSGGHSSGAAQKEVILVELDASKELRKDGNYDFRFLAYQMRILSAQNGNGVAGVNLNPGYFDIWGIQKGATPTLDNTTQADTAAINGITGVDLLGTSTLVDNTTAWEEYIISFTAANDYDRLLISPRSLNPGSFGDVAFLAFDRLAYQNTPALCFDDDNDGIDNHFDLDSDGDGCSDAYEAGVISTELSDITVAPFDGTNVGANGFEDSKETAAESGIYSGTYTYAKAIDSDAWCKDNDEDGVPDFVDIDDDNDGVLDSEEGICNTPTFPATTPTKILETFGAGANPGTELDNIGADFSWFTDLNPTWANAMEDGQYAIVNNPDHVDDFSGDTNGPYDDQWIHVGDHTGDTDGYMLAVNGSAVGEEVYRRTFNNLQINTDIEIDVWILNLKSNGSNGLLPQLDFRIEPVGGGTAFASQSANDIPEDENWHNHNLTINLGSNSAVDFVIYSQQTGGVGNDFAIDDLQLSYYQLLCDDDSDGVVNPFDLDSDNDGCSDAFEAGVVATALADITIAPFDGTNVGDNGFEDSKETAAESGTYSDTYTYAQATDGIPTCCLDANKYGDYCDFDGDGIDNIDDLDDDNDGILDSIEQYCAVDTRRIFFEGFEGGIMEPNSSTDIQNLSPTGTNGIRMSDPLVNFNGVNNPYEGDWALYVTSTLPASALAYEVTIPVASNTEYDFSIRVADVSGVGIVPVFTLRINGNDILTNVTAPRDGTWAQIVESYTTTSTENTLNLQVIFAETSPSGNDLAIDNIEFYQTSSYCDDLDADQDGIVNKFDLDSDDDGCSDAFEAGVVATELADITVATFDGTNVGDNGFEDSKETAAESGSYSDTYTYAQATDGTSSCPSCDAGSTAPVLSASSLQNICPATTADLSTITANNTPTTGTVTLEWHTSATVTDASTLYGSPTAAAAGTYYAVFHDTSANDCYSPVNATPVTVTVAACPAACTVEGLTPNIVIPAGSN